MKAKLFLFFVAVVMLCSCGSRSGKDSKPGAHGWKSPGYGTIQTAKPNTPIKSLPK